MSPAGCRTAAVALLAGALFWILIAAVTWLVTFPPWSSAPGAGVVPPACYTHPAPCVTTPP